jgi:hypothetical protein
MLAVTGKVSLPEKASDRRNIRQARYAGSSEGLMVR